MSLSFEDSLKQNAANNIATTKNENIVAPAVMSVADISIDSPSIMTLDEMPIMAAYSGDDGNWIEHTGYVRYNAFSDDNISIINEKKDITLNENQFNITQEENSQYIPFEMSRKYDGFDLVNTEISICYETKGGRHGHSKPVNVTFNNKKIRFGWLVDAGATVDAGKLKFEIHAYGSVTGSDGESKSYVWKTKPNENLNVLESLCDNIVNEIDDSWMQELVTSVAERVADEIKNVAVGEQVAAAEMAAAESKEYAEDAKGYAETASTAATEVVNLALKDYATTDYVDEAIRGVDVTEQLASYAKTKDVEALVGDIGESKDVVEYVNKKVAEVDVSAQIGDLGADDEGNPITNVVDYVDKKVGDVDVSEQLKNYYTKDETYNQTEIDDKLKNVTVDLTGYATENYVDNKVNESSTPINAAITTINQTLESIDKSPRVTYDATYGDVELDDGSTAEYMFTLWKTENGVREVQDRFQIAGGGGGGAGSVVLRIAYVEGYATPLVSTVDEQVIVKYNFSGEDSAGDTNLDGVASWKVGNRIVATEEVSTGECEFDLTDYVTVGDNKVMLTITHATGAVATKAWTVKVVDVRLESTFDDTKANIANEPVTFTFTPYGGVNKTIHFCLDGEEIDSKTSSAAAAGLSDSFVIPSHAHGTHLFEIYMTADVNGKTVESNHIVKDIIWYDATSDVPVIGCTQQEFTVRQYEAININYTVYDPSTETPSVSLKSTYVDGDGEIVEEYNSNIVMSSNTAIWQYKTDVLGEHTLTITCGDVVKTLTATVVELGIDISPITAGLVFDFNPVGYSNDDTNRLWSNGNIAMTVSDGFDWVNGGYQYDENGDQCFCIKAGTSAEINYELFGDDAKANGKQAKLIFKTKNVANGETVFLSCVSDTIGTDKIGLEMKAHEATIYAKTDSLPLPYAEEEIVEFEFNITPSSEAPSMVMGYEDGVSTRPLVYDDTHDFQQYQGYRKTITLGSDECDLYIYRFKVYNKSLSDKDILNNFIADARSAEEMIERYDRNQIYKEGILDPDYLAEMCPQLRIIKLEVPWFTNDKDDKVYDANRQSIVECVYKGGDPIYDNWVAYDVVHSGQGTSSNNYGAAGRNLDLILKPYKDYGNAPYIVLGDGSRVNKVSLTRESIPVNYFNVKVNIASSENANNALMQKRYNQYNPYNRPFVREDASIIPYIKDTMEFQNCVIFVKESDTVIDGQGNYINHREFNDNNWHFYAIGNIGDSKKTDSSRLTDPSDPYECILEVMDNTLPNSTMPTGKVDINGAPIYPINPSEWTVGNSAYDSLYADKFDESKAADKDNGLADTYGWRYIYEDGTDEENAEVKAYVEQKWKDFYEFVVTSTDEEFKEHLGDWCVLNSVMYYYLFVLRYTLTDNFSKNSFWHYGKSNDLDSEGNPIRKWDLCFDYDNDTCLGIDNYGRMTYRYGYEEIDYVDGTKDWVWNAPNHVFFLRLRKLFDEELCDLYTTLESSGCWSATSLINQWNDWQAQFPEELWRLDIQRKYIRTYTESFINGKAYPEFLTERANGRKKTQRSQFERSQEKYMSSKFGGTVASADDIILRCSVPNTALVVEPNFDITLTAFSHIYASVKYNTDLRPYKYRLKPNETYTFEYNADLADIIEIYSASCMKDIGDLSACYLTNGTFANATKITELILGNSTAGYNNTNVMTLGLGSNELLNKLDIQNMSGLTHSLDLSGLKNLEELYAFGSGTSGVIFADGGNIRIAEIPDVGALQMKNLNYLTDDGFKSSSYYSLSRLVAENSELDLIRLINNSPNLRQVRLTGINWTLDDTSLLERLYNLAGVTNDGGNIDQSVLTGAVHVPTIKQKQFEDYQKAWSDLDITYDEGGLILQHPVTFVNYDGTPLYTQYVDEGGYAIDPVENGDISTPTRESTVSTDFAYAGWNDSLTGQIWGAKTITAQYSETIRKYTIKYVVSESGKETVLQETVGEYGTNVPYTKAIPTYDLKEGENGWTYYLFNRWDKSGFVDGDKTVTAIFDICRYTSGLFNGRELSSLSPVEIYALTKLTEPVDKELSDYGMSIETGDDYAFTMGYDIDYDDIDSEVVIPTKRIFSGATNDHYDTGITLFDKDKDFVLALDYKMSTPLSGVNNATLMQCYQTQGTNGFKLSYVSSPVLAWGGVTTATDGATVSPSATDNREMLVIRHKKGDNNLYIYTSNLNSTNIKTYTIARDIATQSDVATLVFGAAKADNGRFGNYAVGEINWCKIWYKDLGENICRNLASWTHEKITLETSGFHRYQLHDDPSKESMMSLLATHLLSVKGRYNDKSNDNAGGWKDCELNGFLNSRFYNAIPYQIKALLKKVSVKSTIGDNSAATDSCGCYINIPALYDVDDNASAEYKGELYEFANTIEFLTNNSDRVRDFDGADLTDGGESYWLRSPAINSAWATSRYCYSIDKNGSPQQVTGTNTNHGILIEISF
jgi:hypothetical protein